MDMATIKTLEVLRNRRDGRVEGSLLGMLKGKDGGPNAAFNTTEHRVHKNFSTPMGLRMLKSTCVAHHQI